MAEVHDLELLAILIVHLDIREAAYAEIVNLTLERMIEPEKGYLILKLVDEYYEQRKKIAESKTETATNAVIESRPSTRNLTLVSTGRKREWL